MVHHGFPFHHLRFSFQHYIEINVVVVVVDDDDDDDDIIVYNDVRRCNNSLLVVEEITLFSQYVVINN
ncbi:hypothetical protein DERF_010331 [Dermatophagoides farinae]|uniref:Uncharacterized protein n=1 Tax=Dermatophagoides farinae TaxID=6954 RepID=A0A922HVW2_DERFA|nr:hypothetical protein DERF_010331 [Dermatophagoides farinae]